MSEEWTLPVSMSVGILQLTLIEGVVYAMIHVHVNTWVVLD